MLLKRKLKQYGFKWIDVSKDLIKKYRESTKKNKLLDDFSICFKLNREFYSGQADSINEVRDIINYGYLRIIKDNKRNLIIDIHNSHRNRNGKIKFDIKDKINSIYASIYKEEL
jgi:hypothetical protein